ncbi:hypothetical protein QBE54_07015 [Thermatribacter velox]|uniref:Secretin/TonB short N-terminal domain-containing protein n=1 Tax=Thermatribacter velox TaxID=3039681 RepID=A0ABZ2YAJ0_9BACT
MLGVLFLIHSASALELTHFFWRADAEEIKLTFKFSGKTNWSDVSPDPFHIVLQVEGAVNALSYAERAMGVGPLRRIIFKPHQEGLKIWLELTEKVAYEVYEEAGGRLVSVLLKGPFQGAPQKKNLLSFDFRDADLRDVLLALAKAEGVNMVIDDSVEGKISVSFEGLTFDQALSYILGMKGLAQIRFGNNVIVGDREVLEENFGLLEVRRYSLRFANPEDVKNALSLVIPDPERIQVDLASKSLLIKGRAPEFAEVEKILAEMDRPLETRVFTLSNNLYQDEAEFSKFKSLLQIIIPDEERVEYDFAQKSIIVKGTKEELEAVGELLENLDRKRPQIMIDAKLVEINRDKIKDLGVSWKVGGEEGQISFGEIALGGTMERQDLVEATIKALETKNLARLVGNPRILTLSGKEARIEVTDTIPYLETSVDAEGNKSYTVVKETVGVKLTVTPLLASDGKVLVQVKPEVSTGQLTEVKAEGLSWTVPQTSEKVAETTARLRPGETLVIGGLIRSEDIEKITRIPLLSDIPLLGEFFTLRNTTHKETELVVFLTPHIIDY